MLTGAVQFAVVREDAEVDLGVLARTPARRALLVASAGCTAFEFATRAPDTALTLVDPNPAQIDLVEQKLDALTLLDPAARDRRFNVGTDDPNGLCQRGNFEALFRQLRSFLREFVAPAAAWEEFFSTSNDDADRERTLEAWFGAPYWSVAFELFFSDPMLEAMFTPAATRHAVPGSYPAYFRRVIEAGLRREDARANPFLHSIFLGRYLPSAAPPYLGRPLRRDSLEFSIRSLEDVTDFSAYDFVGLSNVMDWMDDAAIDRLATNVRETLRPGAAVVWRQLNNQAPHERRFEPRVAFDRPLAAELLAKDRSLFYERLWVGFAREANDRSEES